MASAAMPMPDPNQDVGPMVLGILVFTLAFGGIFVFMRVLCRSVIKPQFGLDDVFIIIAWLTNLGFVTGMIIAISRGYGKHFNALSPDQLVTSLKAEVIAELFAVASYPPGKASVAYLLQLLFPGRKLRWLLWSFVAANAAFFYINAFLLIFQCSPVAYQWDRTIPGGTCWEPTVIVDWGYLTGVTGAVTDFLFAFLPWFYISKLKMNLKEKVFVGIALSMGFFAGICSILKIYETSTLAATADYEYNTYPLVLWGAAELCAINVAACIPTLRPLFLWFVGKHPRGTTGNSAYKADYGSKSQQVGPFSRRSAGRAHLGSQDSHDANIYHLRSYDVSVTENEDGRSESTQPFKPLGASTTITHAM